MKEAKVLDNISLTFPAGKKIALVGPTGCGKSSIIQLIQRFYKPTNGAIKIDDRNLEGINAIKWRSKIGYVGQEPVMFETSIR